MKFLICLALIGFAPASKATVHLPLWEVTHPDEPHLRSFLIGGFGYFVEPKQLAPYLSDAVLANPVVFVESRPDMLEDMDAEVNKIATIEAMRDHMSPRAWQALLREFNGHPDLQEPISALYLTILFLVVGSIQDANQEIVHTAEAHFCNEALRLHRDVCSLVAFQKNMIFPDGEGYARALDRILINLDEYIFRAEREMQAVVSHLHHGDFVGLQRLARSIHESKPAAYKPLDDWHLSTASEWLPHLLAAHTRERGGFTAVVPYHSITRTGRGIPPNLTKLLTGRGFDVRLINPGGEIAVHDVPGLCAKVVH